MIALMSREDFEISDILLGIFTKDEELDVYAKYQRTSNETLELNGYYFYLDGVPDAEIELSWKDAGTGVTILLSSKLVAKVNTEEKTYTLSVETGHYSVSVKSIGQSEKILLTETPVSSHDVYTYVCDSQTPEIAILVNSAMRVYEVIEQGLELRLQNWDIS